MDGKDIAKIDKYRFRSSCTGVVFQSFHLLPHLTAEENVLLSMNISGKKYGNKKGTAREADVVYELSRIARTKPAKA